MVKPTLTLNAFKVYKTFLDRSAQEGLVKDLREVVKHAPFQHPVTPSGKQMSVKMTAAGQFGWITDRQGYRYSATHPNGSPWPVIPDRILALWRQLVPDAPDPQCCLINFYDPAARMGVHQDKDEADFSWPVLSLSLGDDGLFRVGGSQRSDPTQSIWLASGDVVLMGGDAGLAFHGIDRIKANTSTLLPKGGRINVTLRVVT